jgi:signal transduction histidine kinase
MRWSIRNQLLVPLLVLLLGVVVGITSWSAFAAVRRERQQIETQVRHIAQRFNKFTFQFTPQTAFNVLKQTRDLSGAEYIIVDATGKYTTTFDEELTERPAVENIADDPAQLTLGAPVVVAGREYRVGAFRLTQPANQGSVVYILYPESLWRDAQWAALLPSIVIGSLGGLASLALAAVLAHRFSRRIQELERRTRLIAAGDFSPLPLPGRDDELRDLGLSVNEMAARLARLQEAIQQTERLRLLGQVSGGLAHQLRNSVTGARLAVQLYVHECPQAADNEPLQVALRQLDLVEANLRRFLDLGHADEPRREPCSLTDLVDEAVTLLKPQCKHAHIDLRWQKGDALGVSADAGQLGHLLHNILGNAVDAAGPGGWIEVLARCEGKTAANGAGDRAVVEVRDSGPGPAPEVAERLFEPFVTGKREGVGLGLAVARRVAEAHGGSIAWRRDDQSTCFRIELPLEP